MSHGGSPAVQRRRLRLELRQARQHAGLTQGEVANCMDWSLSKVIRIEAGTVGISTNDLRALLRQYKIVDPSRTDQLVSLARATRERAWWNPYRDVATPGLLQLIEYESAASVLRTFEPLLVPGLLQTEEYALAIIRALYHQVPSKSHQALVEIRMMRQELIDRSDPPLLFFILDEAVIHRMIGNREFRQVQLKKLIGMAERPEVTIEIVPFTVGLYLGMARSFSVLEFPGPFDEDILLFEDVRDSPSSSDAPEEIAVHRELFEDLRQTSLGPDGSLRYMKEIAQDMA